MKDFAVILRDENGQSFGVSGAYILEREKLAEGCTNRWLFQLANGQILEVIIVSEQKKALVVLAGHFLEILKARVRRLGTSLSQI